MTAAEDIVSVEVASQTAARDVAADEAVGGGWGRGPSLWTRPWDDRGGLASVDVAARDGRGGCCIEQMRLLDGAALLLLRAGPLEHSHVTQVLLRFCGCIRGNFRHSQIELPTRVLSTLQQFFSVTIQYYLSARLKCSEFVLHSAVLANS